MAIEGCIERIGIERIGGWCIDRADPDRHLIVRLYVDDREIASGTAARHRPDLEDGGIGKGDHGFLFLFPTQIDAADLDRVTARAIAADGQVVGLPRLKPVRSAREVETVAAVWANLVSRKLNRCILHIGTEKTGTTSLQHFMGLNRDLLIAQGVLAPRSLAPHARGLILNHIGLMTYALDIGNQTERLRTHLGVITPPDIAAHRRDLVVALAREIEDEGKGCSTLLLSNEHCQSRLFLTEEIGRLRNLLLSFCEDVTVVIYVRPQHEVAVSSHCTRLKNGAINVDCFPLNTADGVMSDFIRDFYDYDLCVTRWESVFGRDHVNVRIMPADVIGDFFNQGAIDISNFVCLPARQNVGLDSAAMRFLITLNRPLAALPVPMSQPIRDLLFKALETTHPGRGLLPARSNAEAFQRRFDDSNERLRARRFPARTRLFDDDFGAYSETPETQSASLEETAATVVDVIRDLTQMFPARPS